MIKLFINVFRPLRWYRNLFMILGSVYAIKYFNLSYISNIDYIKNIIIAFSSICFIASGNYGINEVADAESDLYHPEKKNRAVAQKQVSKKIIIIMSIFFYIIGLALTYLINNYMLYFVVGLLLISGLLYNIKPIRLKDKPYLDFISEAFNNPIRLLVGWYAIAQFNAPPPSSLILGFWMLGIFLMSSKRFCEIRFITNKFNKVNYRKSLKYYTENNLLIIMISSIVGFSYMLGSFSMKYNMDLIIILPILIIWVAWYFLLAYQKNSIIKDPERIFEKKYYLLFSIFSILLFIYLFITQSHILGWLKY